MLLVTGEVDRINEREAGRPGNTWIEQTIVVRDWGSTTFVVAGRELAESGLPVAGEKVALEVSVRPYVKKDGGAKPSHEHEAGFGYTAHRRNAQLEAQLFGSESAGLRVASGS